MAAPDYYAALEINSKATQTQIREGYKRQALLHHPDRVPTDSPERATRTRRFQLINDAYYTLSDPGRRQDYDTSRASAGFDFGRAAAGEAADEKSEGNGGMFGFMPGGFPWSTFGFAGGKDKQEAQANKYRDQQFGSVFEEMLRNEGLAEGENAQPTGKFWSMVGTVSGAGLGFILANIPGLIGGAVAGNRLGSVRDTRGKSVYSVFQELDQPAKMRLLSQLAQKVFATTLS